MDSERSGQVQRTPLMERLRGLTLWTIWTIAGTGLLLAVVEGTASLLILVDDTLQWSTELTEGYSTTYDPELGWVAIPDFESPDFYGPGRGLTTERHGFRGATDVSETADGSGLRIVCTGDSFTLGYGVGDEDTWCHQLGERLGVETINMGQGGYGVDQAFLWYRRDGVALEHDIHLFAFIETDFTRAGRTEFTGFAKPMLEVADRELTVTNVPVPRGGIWALRRRLSRPASELRVVRLANGLLGRLRGGETADAAARGDRAPAETLRVMTRMFEELETIHRARGSHLILVNLATRGEHDSDADPSYWELAAAQIAESLGLPLIDLAPELRERTEAEAEELFIRGVDAMTRLGAGHYTEAGNLWAAQVIEAELRALPGTAELLPGDD